MGGGTVVSAPAVEEACNSNASNGGGEGDSSDDDIGSERGEPQLPTKNGAASLQGCIQAVGACVCELEDADAAHISVN